MAEFFHPVQLQPTMSGPQGISPLVSQLMEVMTQGQQLARQKEEDRRRRAREDFAQRLQEGLIQRQAAANTPIDQAPQETVGSVAASQGIPDMSSDVASVAANPLVGGPRRTMSITTPEGKIIPLAPLDYEEEAKQKQVEDIQRLASAKGEITIVTPDMFTAITKFADQNGRPMMKTLYPVGAAIPRAIADDLLKPDAVSPQKWTDPYGAEHVGYFDKDKKRYIEDPLTGSSASSTGDFAKNGEDYLKGLPLQRQSTVRGVGNYELNPTTITSYRGTARQTLIDQARAYNPNFDMNEYPLRYNLQNSFRTGKDSDIMKSLNTVVGHLDRLSQNSVRLHNGRFKLTNWVKNEVKSQMGGSEKANFEKDVVAVADELSTAFKQTGATDSQIAAWHKSFTSSQSPETLADGIAEALSLLQSRLEAEESKYETGMKQPLDRSKFQVYTPKSQQILSDIQGRVSALRGIGSSSAPPADSRDQPGAAPKATAPTIKTKAEWDALPDHAPYVGPDGKSTCKNGCK